MSKVEDKALEAYPKMSRITEPHGVIPADYESHYIGDANEEKRMGFIEGYHQAEKDLLENEHEKSWRLDKKLWKNIKDIEEASYQYMYDASNDWAYDIPTWEDVQNAFKAGAEWKENPELTWQDMVDILNITDVIANDDSMEERLKNMSEEEYCQEVLKRFNKESKNKINKNE